MKELWVEQYRPNTVDGYVFKNASHKEKINGWIEEGSIPHLLLSGRAGIGKTTFAGLTCAPWTMFERYMTYKTPSTVAPRTKIRGSLRMR